jgi:hypothetical protein
VLLAAHRHARRSGFPAPLFGLSERGIQFPALHFCELNKLRRQSRDPIGMALLHLQTIRLLCICNRCVGRNPKNFPPCAPLWVIACALAFRFLLSLLLLLLLPPPGLALFFPPSIFFLLLPLSLLVPLLLLLPPPGLLLLPLPLVLLLLPPSLSLMPLLHLALPARFLPPFFALFLPHQLSFTVVY